MNIKLIVIFCAAISVAFAISVTIYINNSNDEGQKLESREIQRTVVGDEKKASLPER